jgi:gliding motility-associated-like protein
MRKKVLFSGLFFVLLMCATVRFAAQSIAPFDTAACRQEALKKGIPDGDLAGWMRYKVAMYYALANRANEIGASAKMRETEGVKTTDTSACANMNFIMQNFTNWSADTGSMTYNDSLPTYSPGFASNGINASPIDPLARQTILNQATKPPSVRKGPGPIYAGYDSRITNLGFRDSVLPIDSDLTLLSPGSTVSVRLGNAVAGGQSEKLRKTFVVDQNSESFIYSYAAVLELPSTSHTPAQRPSFTVKLLDKNDSLLPGPCSVYYVYAGKDSSYLTYNDTVCNDLHLYAPGVCGATQYNYKLWTTVAVDLSPYIGQRISVEFITRDCSLGGHFGYAYINAQCSNFEITSHFCPQQDSVILVAPVGFVKYVWKDPSGNVLTTKSPDSLILLNPVLNSIYTVEMTSVTGCTSLLKSEILLNPGTVPTYELKQNVFTPNGDGVNDTFKTSQFKFVNAFSIEIFNRWGLKVFSSTDCTKEWDGKIGGAEAPAGTYFWIAKYQSTCDADHHDITSHGFVQLFREKQ